MSPESAMNINPGGNSPNYYLTSSPTSESGSSPGSRSPLDSTPDKEAGATSRPVPARPGKRRRTSESGSSAGSHGASDSESDKEVGVTSGAALAGPGKRRRTSLQAALLAQVRAQATSRDEDLAAWNAWAEAGGPDGGNRAEAVRRLVAWRNTGDTNAELNLNFLALSELPPRLPESLKRLHVSGNALTVLPDSLPAALQELDVSGNELIMLPDSLPATLQVLDVSGNELIMLPDSLPATLQVLNVSGNELIMLPDSLPAALKVLDVSDNELTVLSGSLPAALQELDVSGNELTIPPNSLPAQLIKLNISGTGQTHLPEYLPATLQELQACGNYLIRLPDNLPATLKVLDVSDNELIILPDSLPVTLQKLYVFRNRLICLPDSLPATLQELDVRNNALTGLPENILSRLAPGCTIELANNLLSERVRANLDAICNAPGYHGPTVHFSMAAGGMRMPLRPLEQAVADWHEDDDPDTAQQRAQRWKDIAREAGAEAFSAFLDRLRNTVNYAHPAFRQSVIDWLAHLADAPRLRAASFAISVGATESCNDRILLTFNDMKKARLVADVESGRYDQRLDELVTLAREMFRLDQLEPIARKKVASLRFVDEVEVYLAYQVKLRMYLRLPLEVTDMYFFNESKLTRHDLFVAELRVKQAENRDFVRYLVSGWQPWQSVLERLDREGCEQAQARLYQAVETEFPARLARRLRALGLEQDADARRTLGPQVQAEIEQEIKEPLTRQFLAGRGLAHLLDPQWG